MTQENTRPIAHYLAPASAKHSRFVRASKRFLWLFIAIIIGLMVFITQYNTGEGGSRMVFSNVKQAVMKQAIENAMQNPHYQGVDEKNRPYNVIAEKATQTAPDNYTLNNVKADLALTPEKKLTLTAGNADLNMQTHMLNLRDSVSGYYEGYEFHTPTALVDTKAGMAKGEEAVNGKGPPGELQADSFEIDNKGEIIRFNGSVRVLLYGKP